MQRCSLILFLLLVARVSAQPVPPSSLDYSKVTPSMAVIIVVVLVALFFMGFFSLYLRHCSDSSTSSIHGALPHPRRVATRGLEASVVETFPTLQYSEVKEHKIGKGALECAVCLNEFEEDETLRLIPKCDHVFHQECIDPWLASHVTCPVCRANLVPETGGGKEPEPLPPPPPAEHTVEVHPPEEVPPLRRNQTRNSRSGRRPLLWFPRSHSTGHSLVQPGQNTDRFTLRLPDDVRMRLMSRQLERSVSLLVLPREQSSRRGYRNEGTDASSRGKPPRPAAKLNDRSAKSDRWVFTRNPSFLARASSFLTRSSPRSHKVASNDGEGTSGPSVKPEPVDPSSGCLPV